MEEADKDWMMIRMVGEWLFLLVPAHPGSPGQRAVKRLLLLLFLLLLFLFLLLLLYFAFKTKFLHLLVSSILSFPSVVSDEASSLVNNFA